MLIRERMGAYSDAVFRRDRELWLANWVDDCTWRTQGREFRGKHEMREQWAKIWEMLEKMTFFTEIGAIEVQDQNAKARCYCREILLLRDGGVRKVVGQYDDTLVKENGVWLFASRSYTLLMSEGGAID